MIKIFKYEIPVNDEIELDLPKGAKVLTIQLQKGVPCIWMLVNPDLSTEKRLFWLYGTGMEVKQTHLNYLGSFQMLGGDLIFHLFGEITAF